MWALIEKAVGIETIDPVIAASEHLSNISQDRHFVSDGRGFFSNYSGFLFLKNIMSDISRHLDFFHHMKNPVIHHSYLLYKSAGGPATHLHQDHDYWKNIPSCETMVTLWLFMDDIDSSKGCLTLNLNNRFDYKSGYLFNTKRDAIEHVSDSVDKGFSRYIDEKTAQAIMPNLVPVEGKKGGLVIFDSYEPHASMPNISGEMRKALKIVIGDDLPEYLVSLNDLHNKNFLGKRLRENLGLVKKALQKKAA